jgi:hypothetical protein
MRHLVRSGSIVVLAMLLAFVLAPPASRASGGIWAPDGELNVARQAHTLTLLPDGRVLAAGGYGASGSLASCELYDPATGGWTVTGSLNAAREMHAAVLLQSGKVLVVGGTQAGNPLSSAELYNPATGQWTYTGSMHKARLGLTATRLLDGRVLVVAGHDAGNPLITAELYDPATGQWSWTGSLHHSRYYHTAALLVGGQVLVAGGENGGYVAVTELFNPATGQWTNTGNLNATRSGATATRLPGGRVLLAGGYRLEGGQLVPVAIAELYDPAGGQWGITGSMNAGRYYHSATLLPSGQVLVAGGAPLDGDPVASAELYEPETGQWSTTGSMLAGRALHAATLLQGGWVLAAGGYGFEVGTLDSAELYEPPEAPAMHVAAIVGFFTTDPQGGTLLRMHVLVADEALAPLGDVRVDAWITPPVGGPYARSHLTKPTGYARFHWGAYAQGTWQICVENLTLAGYTYAPDDNVVTCREWAN